MRTKAIKLNERNPEITNSSSFSNFYIDASLNDLKAYLGDYSYRGSGDGKVQFTWAYYYKQIANGFKVITIYDYKEYDIDLEKNPNKNIKWHIGSKNVVPNEIKSFINDKHLESKLIK